MGKISKRAFLQRKGEIGIGTLIVFIAMVLVAAIAAAVIIRTAQSLKNQAEDTGLGAKREVSEWLKILDITGSRGNGDFYGTGGMDSNIRFVEFRVTTWQGSKGIDMQTLTIHLTAGTSASAAGGNFEANYVLFRATDSPVSDYPITAAAVLVGPQGSPGTPGTVTYLGKFGADEIPTGSTGNGWDPTNLRFYLDAENILRIRIEFSAAQGIAPNSQVKVVFESGAGPSVEEQFITPSSYGEDMFIPLI